MTTSGGFAGRGRGGVRLSSNGEVSLSGAAMGGDGSVYCRGRLDAEEMRRLEAAIRATAPSGWHVERPKFAGGDLLRYRLVSTRGNGSTATSDTVTWYDNTVDLLPPDLAALYQVTSEVWARVDKGCAAR